MKTRDVKNRVAMALRLCAQCLSRSKDYWVNATGDGKRGLGATKAITARAHKLARILWHLFKYREAFNLEAFRQAEEKMKRKRLARLQNTAAALGLKLVPAQ